MSSPFAIPTARLARAAAAVAVVTAGALFAAAHAEVLEPARIVAPGFAPPAPAAMAPAAVPAAVAPPAAAAASCTAPAEFSRLDRPLLRTARWLAGSATPLTIVAIGSSSTAGAGASSPAASYPSRLAAELKARLAGREVAVLNRGVNGEETDQMMARFANDVFAAHPQLVLWQVGTNSVLRDHPLKPHGVLLREGVDELKAAGADVVLIDPQYAPQVLSMAETPDMVDQIALVAKEENVDLFHRFAAMRDWHETQHLPYGTFVSADGLHMNDWGYACMAKLLAAAIVEAATRPVASAAAHLTH
jgi:lysophospholipase L1-like esterase